MADQARTIGTRLAEMSLTAPGFIEQRFREGVKLDLAGFEENRQARHALGGTDPYVMLTIIPGEIDFHLNVLSTDHFGVGEKGSLLKALAVVADGQLAQGLSKIFFKYFPPHFPARVFDNEADARAWLKDLLDHGAASAG